MKAIRKKDLRIVSILENYLKDNGEQDEEEQNIDNEELDNNKENHEDHSFILNNPNKQTRPKGRPKGTKRIKVCYEKELSSIANKQYKCGHCGDMGHNKRNCNKE